MKAKEELKREAWEAYKKRFAEIDAMGEKGESD